MKNQNVKIEKQDKVQNKKQSTKKENLDVINVENIKRESTKKFVGLDYTNSTAKEQKRFRAEKRRKLFKIIDEYCIGKLTKKLDAEQTKAHFESFKAFIKENYLIPISECENVFKGTGKKKEDFDLFISDFKDYLNNAIKTKKAKA